MCCHVRVPKYDGVYRGEEERVLTPLTGGLVTRRTARTWAIRSRCVGGIGRLQKGCEIGEGGTGGVVVVSIGKPGLMWDNDLNHE